jgi:lipopolysaccharide/colanic/teichoic acid biosynthesis glycosyltransferase
MITEPLTLNQSYAQALDYNEVSASSFTKKSEMGFLYIGNRKESIYYFSSFFKQGFFADDFSEAENIISSQLHQAKILPVDIIVIDQPLNKPQLESFCKFLKNNTVAPQTPVIYSDLDISSTDTEYLHKTEFVDDVVNINSWEVNYAAKTVFLKNFKRRQQTKLNTNKLKKASFAEPARNTQMLFKRVFDIIISSLLIILCLPLFVLVAIAIRIESKGPVFYNALRAGQYFRVFSFFKFRTMEVDADKKIQELGHLNQYTSEGNSGAKFLKICNDPRITKVGRFLRNTSLDELPQLFNVLRGDMSLVGNRPLPLYEASTLTTNENIERFMAPAGITGLWQVKKRSNLNMSTEERIDLDISYARKYSFAFDMWIILKTPGALFQKTSV